MRICLRSRRVNRTWLKRVRSKSSSACIRRTKAATSFTRVKVLIRMGTGRASVAIMSFSSCIQCSLLDGPVFPFRRSRQRKPLVTRTWNSWMRDDSTSTDSWKKWHLTSSSWTQLSSSISLAQTVTSKNFWNHFPHCRLSRFTTDLRHACQLRNTCMTQSRRSH